MVRAIPWATRALVAGLFALSSVGFAGVAAAAPNCWGQVPSGSAHQPFSNGTAGNAGCGDTDDTSKTSMADIGSDGSWPGTSAAFAVSPWTKVHH
ncbi:hypothetical protein [Mycolicibacterium moriokaense]|uniref:Secreted protein n=1 Tax=Mycolicibacterium moriokaense TaxID=39691 RepID=A0AAD1HBL7_9MYCO|nr:hypothetical protein [Mycolicibacterium moriokaense]MCV7039680.1 hypothetical protein [Mycolicibacterium moriokaense]BBX01871.1 hypothetical protein MMOR_28070 [Mycolicibacterium moriokaense]